MKRIIFLLSVVSIVGISGCKLGPKYQRSQFNLAEKYRFDSVAADTNVNLRWWEMFKDSTLNSLINKALRANKDVMIAASRVEAARATVGYNKADNYPTINIAAGASRGNFSGAKLNSINNNFYAYPELAWELDFWGKYRSATDAARAELLASQYGMRATQISLISNVISTYFQLLEYESKLDISRNTLVSRKQGLKILEQRYAHGMVAEIDVNQSQIQWALAASAVPSYERQIATTQSTLSILLGELPKAITTGILLLDQPMPPDVPTGIPSRLLERRPDIQEAEQYARAANEQIGVSIAQRFPSISLTGLLGVASNDLSTLTSGGLVWSASGSLLGPVFQFGKNKRRVEIAKYQALEANLTYESTVLQAFREVEDALVSIETLKRELDVLQVRYQAAINAEKLSWQRYDKGVTSYLEVIDSQTQSFEAQLDYSETRQELLTTYIQLYNALGGGWLSPEEEQSTIDSQSNNNQQITK
ncbi:MAG: efflux transporter outer membrane subunit [Bacteroidales bacterium]|nr:efflux transporter outer membrane subunit [Bacteroidales bacterium]